MLNLNWDGKTITGVINPGAERHAAERGDARSRRRGWCTSKPTARTSGATVRYVIDGKVENIGAYARFITGTWTQGARVKARRFN